MKSLVKSFLEKHKIDPAVLDMHALVQLILDEMEKGLAGEKSSLLMINSYCSDRFTVKPDEDVLVIDAGGTNCRTCLVHFDSSMEPVISDFEVGPMPGTQGKDLTADEFFTILGDRTEKLIRKADKVGFCFSYEAKITEDHDGYAVSLSKEVQAKEIIGMPLGKGLKDNWAKRGIDVSNKKIMILNDTVTTLLAGLGKASQMGCEGCIGFILGTGTNTAYSENGTIINEESGNLSYAPGDIDQAFIAKTKDPAIHHFEKVISGAYLGPLALEVLKAAKDEGVISCELPQSMSTKDFGEIISTRKMDDDCLDILQALLDRTAMFTAANISASVIRSGYGKTKPCLVNADGSTFYKAADLGQRAIALTDSYLSSKGLRVEFTRIDNSPVIGSAIGALSL